MEYAHPFWKDDVKPKFEETLSRYLGRDASMGLYPTIQAIEEWLKQPSPPKAAQRHGRPREAGVDRHLQHPRTGVPELLRDEFAIRLFLEKADVDLNGKSVSVLGVGSVGNLADYARIAQSLRIPWFAITDEDKVNG